MLGTPNPENRAAVEFYGKTEVLAEIPVLCPLTPIPSRRSPTSREPAGITARRHRGAAASVGSMMEIHHVRIVTTIQVGQALSSVSSVAPMPAVTHRRRNLWNT